MLSLEAVESRRDRYVAGSAPRMGHRSSRTLDLPPITVTRPPDRWIRLAVTIEIGLRGYIGCSPPVFVTKGSGCALQDVPNAWCAGPPNCNVNRNVAVVVCR